MPPGCRSTLEGHADITQVCRHTLEVATKQFLFISVNLKNIQTWSFPGGPVVRILLFHCSRQGFDPWLGS